LSTKLLIPLPTFCRCQSNGICLILVLVLVASIDGHVSSPGFKSIGVNFPISPTVHSVLVVTTTQPHNTVPTWWHSLPLLHLLCLLHLKPYYRIHKHKRKVPTLLNLVCPRVQYRQLLCRLSLVVALFWSLYLRCKPRPSSIIIPTVCCQLKKVRCYPPTHARIYPPTHPCNYLI